MIWESGSYVNYHLQNPVGSVELDHKAGISYATTALAHSELGTMQVLLTGGAYVLS